MTQAVFVDDSDPSIIYSGEDAWAVQTGILTAPQPFNLPARAPFYDGKKASVGEDQYQVNCQSLSLPDGEHNLTVSVTQNIENQPPSDSLLIPDFDGLFYIPSNSSPVHEVDIAFAALGVTGLPAGTSVVTEANSGSLSVPGDGIDFEFNGTSMAVYVTYMGGSSDVAMNLSYNVDDGPSINFTLDNPSTTFSAAHELILQTPQYARGQHQFRLDYLGPAAGNQGLILDMIMVQNAPDTQKLVGLQVFPPIPSSITSSTSSSAQPTTAPLASKSPTASPQAKSTPHRVGQETIIATAVTFPAVLVILILAVLFIKRQSRRRTSANFSLGDGSEVSVTPFLPTTFARRMAYTTFSKGLLDSQPNLTSGAQNTLKGRRLMLPRANSAEAAAHVPAPTAQGVTDEPIYRIHEDGGSVHETINPEQRQVIDLPPLYSSNFGRRGQEPAEEANTGGQGI
ncbi:hypothetical protein CPC08DRAFT_751986 [Agrocybe pediades]|nr:hypothetical protein CPC08DRAFT_751986 [Agrocybe pediades]